MAGDLVEFRGETGRHVGEPRTHIRHLAGIDREVVERIVQRSGIASRRTLRRWLTDELPGSFPPAESARAVVLLEERPPARSRAEQCGRHVHAVGERGLRHLRPHDSGDALCQIDRADDLVGRAGGDPAGPAGNEWRAGAPLENAVFATTEWPGGLVAAEPFGSAVPVAVIEHRAVVAAEHDQRVVGTFQPIERRGDLADRPVDLHDAVAARAHAGGSLKAFVWHPRHVDVVRGEKQKEGFLRVSLDPPHALADPGVGEVLIAESGPRATREETDAADPVVNRVVMPL